MTFALISVLSTALWLQPVQETPQDQAAQQTAAPQVAEDADAADTPRTVSGFIVNEDGMVCRTRPRLGSRIQVKICVTPEQAQAAEDAARQYLESMQYQQTEPTSPG